MDSIDIVRTHYDQSVEHEWARIANRPEFLMTARYMQRYIQPDARVLDIGGGPGRYSIHLAQRGCAVTLFDLSPGNVAFAQAKAQEEGVALEAICGNALEADALLAGRQFDHVLLMGPLYHLLEEDQRLRAVEAAVNLLKPGGMLFATFINLFAGMVYAMKFDPALILAPEEASYYEQVLARRSFAGPAFTEAFFIDSRDVLPLMARFPLEKRHFVGQEGILSPLEQNIMEQPQEVVEGWLDFSMALGEREDLINYAEHILYIGERLP